MSITIAHTRPVFDIHAVQEALDLVQERSPTLKACYEQMIESGALRYQRDC
jgi:ATP-dependent Lon protease